MLFILPPSLSFCLFLLVSTPENDTDGYSRNENNGTGYAIGRGKQDKILGQHSHLFLTNFTAEALTYRTIWTTTMLAPVGNEKA